MEETSCEIICGAPTTLAVKGLMMMMTASVQLIWPESDLLLIVSLLVLTHVVGPVSDHVFPFFGGSTARAGPVIPYLVLC